jgi:dinuclear metal center YbgI/SA1388 family protein
MAQLNDIIAHLASYLKVDAFQDYCPNGLQVEGRAEIRKIVTGVTACQSLLDAAVACKADAVLVHHGYFWRGDDPVIKGPMKRRLQTLLQHDISLLAYHLPLDAHPDIGNNALLAKALEINIVGEFDVGQPGLGWLGELNEPVATEDFSAQIKTLMQRNPLCIDGGKAQLQKIAWCTGAAQDFITAAAKAGADAYITGEVSERTVHLARELGIAFYAAGHHATERFGIQALGEYLQQQFDIGCEFIDIANPV